MKRIITAALAVASLAGMACAQGNRDFM